jgi:glycine/D-amino acid oxidase-like deaminating enzyme
VEKGAVEDVVVVGGGIVGMAVAAELGRRGHGVRVLERSAAAAATGSSKGTARFRQLADYPDESFLDLGIRAREIWGDMETVAGERIFRRTGNLSIGDAADLTKLTQGLRSRNLPVEEVAGGDMPRRWPHLRVRADDVLFQPDGEVIAADVAYRAMVAISASRGVSVVRGVTVVGVDQRPDRLLVLTSQGPVEAARVVLAPGPWVAGLAASVGLELDVHVSCQTVAWFEVPADVVASTPTVTQWSEREPYLLPDGRRLKAAEHERGPERDPDDQGSIDRTSVERLRAFVTGLFVVPLQHVAETDTCLYTNAPGDRIVIETSERVVAVSACSGQGFQYAPAVAALVSDVVEAT